jgi:hypothetical protein
MLFYNITKFFENPYREDLIVKLSFIASLVINLTAWIVLYWKLNVFSYQTEYGQIFLHYNIYFGVDNIGSWYKAFIIPLLGIIIIIFNNILAYSFYLKERLISYVLVVSQVLIQLVLLAASIFVILLNI